MSRAVDPSGKDRERLGKGSPQFIVATEGQMSLPHTYSDFNLLDGPDSKSIRNFRIEEARGRE